MIGDIESRATHFRYHWWGYGAGMVALYAFSAPLLRYASPEILNWVGYLVAGVLFFGYWAFIHRGDREATFMSIAALICAVTAAHLASTELSDAVFSSRANDKRCLAIQRDMLSAHRRMIDGPTVFQALGCRPQGQGLIFVPPTDRELHAKRGLKDGGYPVR